MKRIEMEVYQKLKRLIRKRMEEQSRETPKEKRRRDEVFRVIEKLGNTPIRNNENEQGTSKTTPTEKKQITTAKKPHPQVQMIP